METTAHLIEAPDEAAAVLELVSAAFGDMAGHDNPAPRARIQDLSIGVDHGDRLIGGCFALAMDLTLPGGRQLPVAGLSAVGIDPSATGLGGMTAMVELHLAESRRRGLAASVLSATESHLYSRYGYGRASTVCRYEIELDRAALTPDAPIGGGKVRLLLDPVEARDALVAVHLKVEGRAGMTSRTPEMWDVVLAERPNWTGGGDRFVAAHYPIGGAEPDGYVIYRVKHTDGGHRLPAALVRVDELVAANVAAELTLWEYLRRLPLARTMEWNHAPVDPIVAAHLVDRRQLTQARRVDNLWLRILDVDRLLASRSWPNDGVARFVLDDQRFPDQAGLYQIRVVDGTVDIAHEAAGPVANGVVVLTPGLLASLVMGETRATGLARCCLIAGESDEIRDLDRIMMTEEAPFSLTRF